MLAARLFESAQECVCLSVCSAVCVAIVKIDIRSSVGERPSYLTHVLKCRAPIATHIFLSMLLFEMKRAFVEMHQMNSSPSPNDDDFSNFLCTHKQTHHIIILHSFPMSSISCAVFFLLSILSLQRSVCLRVFTARFNIIFFFTKS